MKHISSNGDASAQTCETRDIGNDAASGKALTSQKKEVKKEQGNDDTIGKEILKYYRDIPPAHNIFKIESFSNFLKSNTKHQSDKFWACGLNWRVSVYPKEKNNGDADYLSIYLEIVDTHTLSHDWEVHVNYKLFVYDHLEDKYYTIQDADSKIRRFRSTKIEWGFDRILTHQTFSDDSKGYIRDDACIFGAEVFVIKQNVLMKDVNPYTWKVEKFSTIKDDKYLSKTFVVCGYTWCLSVYPKGDGEAKDKSLSLYLLADWVKQNPTLRLCAEFNLRIKNQYNNTYHEQHASAGWFSASQDGWGFRSFLSLVDLNDKSKGFLLNDTIILEVEITTLSLIKK